MVFCNLECFCNLVRCLQILCKLFCKGTSVAKNFYRNLACFVFLAFYFHIFLFYKCAQMCANCVQNFMCKIIFAIYFILQFLLFLFTSFSCYCGIVLQILGTLIFIFLGLWNYNNNNNNNNLFPSGTVIHYLTQIIRCYYKT